jgi:hypothetical protein
LDGVTIRTSVLKDGVRFDEDLRQTQDTDLMWQLALGYTILPGRMLDPVSMRGVHTSNRIHDIRRVHLYHAMLYEKWLSRLRTHDWTDDVRQRMLYRAVYFSSRRDGLSSRWTLIRLLLRMPWLLKHVGPRACLALFRYST